MICIKKKLKKKERKKKSSKKIAVRVNLAYGASNPGDKFLISVDEMICSVKLRRLKLFHRLEMDSWGVVQKEDCCLKWIHRLLRNYVAYPRSDVHVIANLYLTATAYQY